MYGQMLDEATEAAMEYDLASMGESLFAGYDVATATLKAELAAAVQVAAELTQRVAEQDIELNELRRELAGLPRLKSEVSHLRAALQQADAGARELQMEKEILHDAADRLSKAEIASRGVARGATLQLQLEASSAEARVQAATRRLEASCQRRIAEVETELETVREYYLRKTGRRERFEVSKAFWLSQCISRALLSEHVCLLQAAFYRWARLPKTSQELWNMHVFYLHEQEKRHAEESDLSEARFLTLIHDLLDFRSRDLVAYWVVHCFLAWQTDTRAQLLLKRM